MTKEEVYFKLQTIKRACELVANAYNHGIAFDWSALDDCKQAGECAKRLHAYLSATNDRDIMRACCLIDYDILCRIINSEQCNKNNHSDINISFLDCWGEMMEIEKMTLQAIWGVSNDTHYISHKDGQCYLKPNQIELLKGINKHVAPKPPLGQSEQASKEPTPTASDERPIAIQMPTELNTDRAKEIFAKAVEAGLMSKDYEWRASKSLLACFCREMSVKLDLGKAYNSGGQKRLVWKPFEQLFNAKKGSLRASLNDIQKTGQNPIGIEKINAIFQE
ncbi:MAG: hypothetical protein MR843_01070 [Bacteroidales bacterium]|nr:hypothetical protein [Bacteroidales bacterium]